MFWGRSVFQKLYAPDDLSFKLTLWSTLQLVDVAAPLGLTWAMGVKPHLLNGFGHAPILRTHIKSMGAMWITFP